MLLLGSSNKNKRKVLLCDTLSFFQVCGVCACACVFVSINVVYFKIWLLISTVISYIQYWSVFIFPSIFSFVIALSLWW